MAITIIIRKLYSNFMTILMAVTYTYSGICNCLCFMLVSSTLIVKLNFFFATIVPMFHRMTLMLMLILILPTHIDTLFLYIILYTLYNSTMCHTRGGR